jgi:cobalt-zinc-cadmium efflux system outer membrane protein
VFKQHRKKLVALFAGSALLFSSLASASSSAASLSDLESMMFANSNAIKGAADAVQVAKSAVDTARAIPNPEVEVLSGTRSNRITGLPVDRQLKTLSVTQDLDMPWHRFPRVDAAQAGLLAANANEHAFRTDMRAKLRLRFHDLIRRQAEGRASKEDSKLMEGIRSRIALRVETGEAARFELIKADAEMLNAQKVAQSAELRIRQSRAALRALVGPQLPEDFEIQETGNELTPPAPLADVRAEILRNNPELLRTRAERQQLDRKLSEEKALRFPKLALRAEQDQDLEYRSKRVGVALSLPLWNWRGGPVGEAAARLSQSNNQLAYQEFSLLQSLDVAYQQYDIAQAQMVALESGIVLKAASALRIVEVAYKAGEKGFLEVLDAQRVYRAARNELIVARYELATAWAEIERLRATSY